VKVPYLYASNSPKDTKMPNTKLRVGLLGLLPLLPDPLIASKETLPGTDAQHRFGGHANAVLRMDHCYISHPGVGVLHLQ
jgi:hypothetical protein